ncbi:hypothetical protein V8E53_005941 [Lactarius tabidus]
MINILTRRPRPPQGLCLTDTQTQKYFFSPQVPSPVNAYTDMLDRLNVSVAFGLAEENQRDTLAASGSTGSHLVGSDFQYSPFPSDDLLSSQASPSYLPSTYAILLTPLTTLFNTALSSLLTLIQRPLHKYTFHVLASYSSLSVHQDR